MNLNPATSTSNKSMHSFSSYSCIIGGYAEHPRRFGKLSPELIPYIISCRSPAACTKSIFRLSDCLALVPCISSITQLLLFDSLRLFGIGALHLNLYLASG